MALVMPEEAASWVENGLQSSPVTAGVALKIEEVFPGGTALEVGGRSGDEVVELVRRSS